jgi:hypothetical protein
MMGIASVVRLIQQAEERSRLTPALSPLLTAASLQNDSPGQARQSSARFLFCSARTDGSNSNNQQRTR